MEKGNLPFLNEIDDEYEKTKSELQVYSYKFSITKQVVQSTLNEEIIRNIRELYHKPFEQKYSKLKADIKDLEEKKRVFKCLLIRLIECWRKGKIAAKFHFLNDF